MDNATCVDIIPNQTVRIKTESSQATTFQGRNTIINAFPELFICHGWIAGCLPDLTGKLITGSAVCESVLVGAAGIDRTGFFVCVKHFSAGFIAAGRHVTVKRTGRTVRSTDRQSQDFPLLLFRKAFQNQFIGSIQPVFQQIIRNLTVRLDGIPVLLIAIVSGNNVRILPAHQFSLHWLQLQIDVIWLIVVI